MTRQQEESLAQALELLGYSLLTNAGAYQFKHGRYDAYTRVEICRDDGTLWWVYGKGHKDSGDAFAFYHVQVDAHLLKLFLTIEALECWIANEQQRLQQRRSTSATSFDFAQASEEARRALRNDAARCVAALAAGRELATRLATLGVSAPLSPAEESRLQEIHWVLDAHQSSIGEHETALSLLRQRAGLSPSDLGLLEGRLLHLYQEREPALHQAELFSFLYQLGGEASG